MLQETDAAADVAERLLVREEQLFARLGRLLRERDPFVVTTAARGSSDHAATYFKYLFEIAFGRPVASLGPSVASVYRTEMRMAGGVHLTISQSGASPDIIAAQAAAKAGGAATIALVNVVDSELAGQADYVVPLHAGQERSVAATKSFIASAVALGQLAASAAEDTTLAAALRRVPESLHAAASLDLAGGEAVLADARSIYTAGRGPGFAMAAEAALKAKETAGIHAESFSLAEIMHGPLQLVGPELPVVAFLPADEAARHNEAAVEKIGRAGSPLVTISSAPAKGNNLRMPTTGSGFIDPIVFIAAYYRLIESVTRRRGLDPDRPKALSKVTETR